MESQINVKKEHQFRSNFELNNNDQEIQLQEVKKQPFSRRLSFLKSLVLISSYFIGEAHCGRLNVVQNNTASTDPTAFPVGSFVEGEGRFADFANGNKGFIYLISNFFNPNLKFVPLDGTAGSIAGYFGTINYGYKISLNWKDPSIIFYSFYGSSARGYRMNLQLLSGVNSLSAVQAGISKATEYSTATVMDQASNFIVSAGSQDWKYICKFDVTLNLYGSHTNSPQLANMGWNKFAHIFSSNFLILGGYYTHQLLLNFADLTLIKNFSNPGIECGYGLLNNLDSNELYLDGRDLKITSVDLTLGTTPNHYLRFTPIVMPTGEERGITNLESLQMLCAGDKTNSEMRIYSKTTFTLLFIVNFMDGIATDANTLRVSQQIGNKIYYGRIETINKNIQQWYLTFDNCTYRLANEVCTACSPGYYRTNLTKTNECILPQHFPPLYGIDDPNILMMSCASNCLDCLLNYSYCTLCDHPNFYYGLQGVCYSTATVPSGFGLNSTSNLFVPCTQTIECTKCQFNFSQCTLCNQTAGYYMLGTVCYNATTVPDTYGLNTTTLIYETCQSVGCVRCAGDKTVCIVCNNTAGYYLLGSVCYTTSNVPNSYGLDTLTSTFVSCSLSGCSICAANYEVCSTCDNGNNYYNLASSCYTTATVPDGYGFDIANLKFVSCESTGCTNCNTNFQTCTVCNNTQGYYIMNSNCYTTASIPTGFGLDSTNNLFTACTVPGCSACPSDYSTCTTCQTGSGYYLYNQLCYTTTSIPNGLGLNSTTNTFQTCSTTGCLKCASNFSSCTDCDNGAGYFTLNGPCYTVASVPDGFGFDSMTNSFVSCQSGPSCKTCPSDKSVCSSCKPASYFKDGTNDCYTTLSIPDGFGLNTTTSTFVACTDSPTCTRCSVDNTKCTKCDASSGKLVYQDTCILPSSSPPGFGPDSGSGTIISCADDSCVNCLTDFNTCTECSSSSGKVIENGVCIPLECLNGGCQPKVQSECNAIIKKIKYEVISQSISFYFRSKLDLFAEYAVNLYLIEENGERRQMLRPEYDLEFQESILRMIMNLTEPLYEVQLEIHLSLLPGIKCKNNQSFQNTTNITSTMSFSPVVISLGKSTSAVGATLAFGSTTLALLSGGSRIGISRIIQKLLSNFVWLKVINGMTLLYPTVAFGFIKDDRPRLLPFGNPFSKKTVGYDEDCEVYENYESNGITCRMMINLGDDIIFMGIAFLINSLVTLCFLTFKYFRVDRYLKKGDKETAKLNKNEKKYAAFRFVNRYLGVRFFLMELWGNSMKIICFVIVQMYFMENSRSSQIGMINGCVFILLYLIFTLSCVYYIRSHSDTIKTSMKFHEDKRESKLFLINHIDEVESTRWDFMEFAFERMRVPSKYYFAYFPVFEIVRSVGVNLLLLVLTPLGLVQVYVATIIQFMYTIFLIRSRSKASRFERYTECITSILELIFCFGKIAVYSDMTTKKKQEIIGAGLCLVIFTMVVLNVAFLIYQLVIDVICEPIDTCMKKKKISMQNAKNNKNFPIESEENIAKKNILRAKETSGFELSSIKNSNALNRIYSIKIGADYEDINSARDPINQTNNPQTDQNRLASPFKAGVISIKRNKSVLKEHNKSVRFQKESAKDERQLKEPEFMNLAHLSHSKAGSILDKKRLKSIQLIPKNNKTDSEIRAIKEKQIE